MKHTIRRFVPVDSLDIAAMESWLADMAGDGLFLASFGIGGILADLLANPMLFGYFDATFANFQSGTPRKAAYRLEPANPAYIPPDDKKQALFAEFGWEYVCPVGYFHVYRAKTEDAPEIHTDPSMQAEAYTQIARSVRNKAILIGVLFVALTCLLAKLPAPGFFNYVLHGGMIAVYSAAIIVSAVFVVRQFLRLNKIRNLLKNGTHLSHSGDYRKRKPWHIATSLLSTLLFVAFSIMVICRPSLTWDANWRELSEPIPMVSLAEIEQDSAFQNGHIDDANTTYIGGDSDNEIRFDRSFLAPEQITITQSGFVPGQNWMDDGRPYEASLKISIYRLRFPSMGAHFVESQMDWELFDLIPWDTLDLSSETGLVEAHLCVSGKFGDALKKLFLRQGDTVMFVEYIGEADLRPFVPQFAALMQETYPTKKPR